MLTSGRRLTRNALYSLIGQAVPLLAFLAATRLLIHGLGDVRFGVLMLAWAAAGYFSIFDFGLARAMTHAVAGRLGAQSTDDLAEVVWTALTAMAVLGVLGTIAVLLGTPLLVDFIGVTGPLADECRRSFYIIALSIPFMVSTSGFRGLLEAHQAFGVATLLRIPLALTAFLGPVLILPFTSRLEPIIAALVAGRVLMWALHLIVCVRRFPFLRNGIRVRWAQVRPLLHYSGWTTVTNVVVPLMSQVDRFGVAAFITVEAAAYYALPIEIATKLWIVPMAVTAVLFPSFTTTFVSDRARTVRIMDMGLRGLAAMLYPIALVLVAFAPEVLAIWLGKTVAATAGIPVLRWVIAGAFAVGIGQVLVAALQGIGRPDLVATLQLVELPLYWAAFWFAATRYGLTGVAVVSAARMVVDTAMLHLLLGLHVRAAAPTIVRSALRLTVLLLSLTLVALPASLVLRAALALLGLLAFGIYTWTSLIPATVRATLTRSVREAAQVPPSAVGVSADP